MRHLPAVRYAAGFLIASLIAVTAASQQQSIRRTILQRTDLGESGSRECILALAELPAGAAIGKHFHHGIETGYVVEGSLELTVDGQPTRRLEKGDSYQIAARTIHDAINVGTANAVVSAFWVVDKGKPLSEPAT
jgi:quercetin dioxygenase-like cupin family protein